MFSGSGVTAMEEDRRKAHDSDAYYDALFPSEPVLIAPGAFECAQGSDVMLVARVGSGIAVCIHDMEIGVGAMAHVLLPPEIITCFPNVPRENNRIVSDAEALIDRMIGALKHHGAGRSRIRVRICGGTSIHDEVLDEGLKNYILAKDMLMRRGLRVAGEDIAGRSCRRVHFFPGTGRLVRQPLRRAEDIARIRAGEAEYLAALPKLF